MPATVEAPEGQLAHVEDCSKPFGKCLRIRSGRNLALSVLLNNGKRWFTLTNTMDSAIDLNAIAILTKVAELTSFRGAAKALGLPRSTVSLKIAQLERQLGVRLLERTTRLVRPTEAGNAYLRMAEPALEALADAGRAAADLSAKPSGLLRVTAPPELGQLLFGQVLTTFLSRYPSVKVHVELTARRVNLLEEGFDVALRAGELLDSSLFARAIGRSSVVIACANADYLQRRGIPRHPKELLEHDCLVMSDRQEPTRWTFQEQRKRITVHVEPRASINSFLVLRDLAVAGQGITRLPEFLARDDLQKGSLTEILTAFAPPQLAFHALYAKAGKLSSKVQSFLATLDEECKTLW